MIIPLWTAQGGSLFGQNAKSFFPRAPTYQHRKNNDVKIEDVSYNIHTTSKIRKNKKKTCLPASELRSYLSNILNILSCPPTPPLPKQSSGRIRAQMFITPPPLQIDFTYGQGPKNKIHGPDPTALYGILYVQYYLYFIFWINVINV